MITLQLNPTIPLDTPRNTRILGGFVIEYIPYISGMLLISNIVANSKDFISSFIIATIDELLKAIERLQDQIQDMVYEGMGDDL